MTRCSTGRSTQKYKGGGTDLSDILESEGDIIYADATLSAENLVISGTPGDVLKVSASGIPEWGASTGTSQWATSGDDISYITGNVGIGTTAPDATLHVVGNTFVSTDLGLGGTLTMGTVLVEALHELSAITATGNLTPHVIRFTNPKTGFVTTGNVSMGKDLTVAGNVAVDTNTLFVDTVNNRVGNGTVTPGYTLDVVGDVNFTGEIRKGGVIQSFGGGGGGFSGGSAVITATSGYGNLEVGGPSGAYIDLKGPATDDFDIRMITTGAGGQIQVAGGTTAMYFASSGRVGIGTTTPTSALDVVGTVKATAFDGVNKVIYATAEKAVSTWTDRTIDASFWRSVTWSPELSLFVAVATTGTNRAATSPDGITWTNRTIDFSGWKSVTWSPDLSLFVAVAFSGTNRVATSPDGVTWTGRTIAPNLWQSVTWSPELSLFVAVAFYKAATSPDGVTWTSRTINTGSQWRAVTWSPELSLFVAVAKSGTNRVATSPDGVTWTDRVINTVSKWQSVTWSPELSLFVAVGDYGSVKCTTSPDGITWTDRVISTAHGWESVTWSPELSLFVAVASTGTNRVATSPDGVTWTSRTINTGSDWQSVTWSPELSLFVAMATTGTNRVATSNFGIPTSLNTPMAHPVQLSVDTVNSRVGIGTTTPTVALDVAGDINFTGDVRKGGVIQSFGGGGSSPWVTSGNDISYSTGTVKAAAFEGVNKVIYATAEKAVSTWTSRTIDTASGWTGVTWSPELSLFVAVATTGTNRAATSPDGITWTNRTIDASGWSAVTWSLELSLFVAVASSGTNRVATSPDGVTWTGRTIDANSWHGVAWSPELSLFVAVAKSGTNRVATSPDGVTWTSRTIDTGSKWQFVTWSPELTLFVAVAYSGTYRAATSPDGVTWTNRTIDTGPDWRSVTWSPELSLFVVVGGIYASGVATSPDGVTWTNGTIDTGSKWRSVTWSPEMSLFVAVADTGTNLVATSPDGVTWTNRTIDASLWQSVTWSPELSLFVAVATAGTNRVATSNLGIPTSLNTPMSHPGQLHTDTATGNVGIGTTTPTVALDVAGDINFTGDVRKGGVIQSFGGGGSSPWVTSGNDISYSTGTVKAAAFAGVNKVIYTTAEKAVSTWTTRTIASDVWKSVTWSPELSLFVAVAYYKAATSPDGVTWTNRTISGSSGWASVTWSPELSLFVAVAASGAPRAATSPNGITWTARTITTSDWTGVTWSPNLSLFVAVAYNGTVRAATSPNGITWTDRTINTASGWWGVTWSPELSLFVAVAYNGAARAATSSDGITWTDRAINTASGWTGVTWSPELSLLVAVAASGTYRAATSPDGITWTDRTIVASFWWGVAWSPELSIFVAVGSNQLATSPDGITWTTRTIVAGSWEGVAWSPELSLFAAVAASGTYRAATSNLGIPTSLNTPMAHPGQLHVDTATGNVGVGTSSPTSALDVNGTVTATTFSASGPTTGAAHGSSSILYLLNTPLIKEWQWTGSTNNTLRVTFSTSELPTNCKAIYADVFMPQHSTDDHVGHALGKNAGEQTMWTSGRNVQPSTVFGNLALQQCFLSMPGQTDAFEYYYGNWWNSCIIPLDTTNTLYHTVSGEGATSSWVYMVIKGYFH